MVAQVGHRMPVGAAHTPAPSNAFALSSGLSIQSHPDPAWPIPGILLASGIWICNIIVVDEQTTQEFDALTLIPVPEQDG
jgi:hypothetical protein